MMKKCSTCFINKSEPQRTSYVPPQNPHIPSARMIPVPAAPSQPTPPRLPPAMPAVSWLILEYYKSNSLMQNLCYRQTIVFLFLLHDDDKVRSFFYESPIIMRQFALICCSFTRVRCTRRCTTMTLKMTTKLASKRMTASSTASRSTKAGCSERCRELVRRG